MSKHTKGPWFVNDEENEERFCAIVTGGLQVVADNVYGKTPEEAEANALLISKVPDMYEALLDIYENSTDHQAIARARSALNEAGAL